MRATRFPNFFEGLPARIIWAKVILVAVLLGWLSHNYLALKWPAVIAVAAAFVAWKGSLFLMLRRRWRRGQAFEKGISEGLRQTEAAAGAPVGLDSPKKTGL